MNAPLLLLLVLLLVLVLALAVALGPVVPVLLAASVGLVVWLQLYTEVGIGG